MKQILLFYFVLGFTTTSLAQYTDTTKHNLATDYLQKSNKQKKAGWILLGGGAAMTGIGIIVGATAAADELITGDSNGLDAATILIPVGLLSMAGSIPLFIAAGKNRRKAAASVLFKLENATTIYQWAVSNCLYPAVAIRFHL